jgi:hypothetical protein
VILLIEYTGDIGEAYINGTLIHDHFANGDIWEIGLKQHMAQIMDKGLYIQIVPLLEGSITMGANFMAAEYKVNRLL